MSETGGPASPDRGVGEIGPQILAIDLGTSGMKAALVAVDGTLTGWASKDVGLRVLPGGGAEQSPQEWWTALGECAAQLRAEHPRHWDAVVGVCSSTQGEGTIPLGADLEPLHDCILWMDMRGEKYLKRQFGAPLGGRAGVNGFRADTLARWVRLTGGAPSPTGKDPASHMLFVRDEMPEVYERTKVFVNVVDYLDVKLTGRVVAPVDSILTSWVTDNRRPDAIAYHPRLVADCGIDPDKLPDIVPCTEVVGTLTREASEHLGLPMSVHVVAGAIDTSAAAVGAGTVEHGDAHLYLGTSSWIAAHVNGKKTDLLHGIASVPCALPDRYLLTALQATAGGNLSWVRDNVLRHDDPFVVAERRGDVYDLFDAAISRSPAGAHGVIYMPWIHGERAPVDDPSLRAGLVNVGLHTSGDDLVRAVFEGIALNTRWMLGPVRRFVGSSRAVQSLALAGGGAQSDAWCQILADVLDVHIRRLDDPLKVNARGAGWIGAMGLGEITPGQLPSLVRTDRVFEPDPEHRRVYEDAYGTFTDLAKRLAPVYRRIARGGGTPPLTPRIHVKHAAPPVLPLGS